jgi:hypothetical protein
MRGDDPASRFRRPVLWSRGRGCGELASLLGEAGAVRLTGDRMRACIDERAEVLVTRRLPGRFDLVSVVLPVEVDPDAVGIVVAAVAEGPHSTFAACVARRLGAALGVAAEMISAHQEPADRAAAEATLVRIARELPDLPGRSVAENGIPPFVPFMVFVVKYLACKRSYKKESRESNGNSYC